MFGSFRGKPLNEMTTKDIVAVLIAFTVIGVVIVVVMWLKAFRYGISWFGTSFAIVGTVFVTTLLIKVWRDFLVELRRRKRQGERRE
jgi:uncharacterized protein (DUF983 family)